MDVADAESIARIVAALRGNAEQRRWAVDQLYKSYAGRIKRYMLRAVVRDEAEALMHEVFIRVLRHGHTFREDTQRFEAWLWTITRNLLLDTVKARLPKNRQTEGFDIDSHEVPDDSIDHEEAERIRQIQDCYERGYASFKLKFPARAEALSWLVTDQLGIQDIAQILGRTPGATRQYLLECRQRFKPYVDPCREHLEA